MNVNPALLGPMSMFLGALMGGSASLIAAIYTRRMQNRVERVACEVAKRETVYGDFLMSASNFLLLAVTRDEILLGGDEHRLMGLINRMRLFAPDDVVCGAETVLRALVEIALKPSIELRQFAKEALASNFDPDPLQEFSEICRTDLDRVRRSCV